MDQAGDRVSAAAPLRIAGAGFAGLLAAHAWPQAAIFDPKPAPAADHKALLRFRSDKVSRLTGIPFRRVTVRKGLWSGDQFVAPNIALANAYSRKVLGRLEGERSVWNLDAVERFIAPEDFYEQLLAAVGHRVQWGVSVGWENPSTPIVSTAPLPVALKAVGLEADWGLEFHRAAIHVRRYRVSDADVHQTVYFPDPTTPIYRASITGSLLIVESMHAYFTLSEVSEAFGLHGGQCELIEEVSQKYGKILPLSEATRKAILLRLTQQRGIYSLGRFATWRNVLLDDVVEDIDVIRRLLRVSQYDTQLHYT
jgi:hypothetical protein